MHECVSDDECADPAARWFNMSKFKTLCDGVINGCTLSLVATCDSSFAPIPASSPNPCCCTASLTTHRITVFLQHGIPMHSYAAQVPIQTQHDTDFTALTGSAVEMRNYADQNLL